MSEILFYEQTLGLFRERYLAELGSPVGDPMYEAARAEIRRGGIEAWLPLFHANLDTLYDYIGSDALIGLGSKPRIITRRVWKRPAKPAKPAFSRQICFI